MARYYYLGPWRWVTDDEMSYWAPPVGAISSIDLRGQGGSFGFFVTEKPLGSDYELMGTQLDDPLTVNSAKLWVSMLGTDKLQGATVLDALVQTLSIDQDPDGEKHGKGLLPTHLGVLEIWLCNERVWHRKFTGLADPSWPRIQGILHRDYRKIREVALIPESKDITAHRRVLGTWKR